MARRPRTKRSLTRSHRSCVCCGRRRSQISLARCSERRELTGTHRRRGTLLPRRIRRSSSRRRLHLRWCSRCAGTPGLPRELENTRPGRTHRRCLVACVCVRPPRTWSTPPIGCPRHKAATNPCPRQTTLRHRGTCCTYVGKALASRGSTRIRARRSRRPLHPNGHTFFHKRRSATCHVCVWMGRSTSIRAQGEGRARRSCGMPSVSGPTSLSTRPTSRRPSKRRGSRQEPSCRAISTRTTWRPGPNGQLHRPSQVLLSSRGCPPSEGSVRFRGMAKCACFGLRTHSPTAGQ